MRKLLYLFTLFFIVGWHTQANAQRDFSDVEIKPTKLTETVYMFTGSGGNIGVSIGPDGVLIIDDQFAPLAEKIQTALNTIGGKKPSFILNTHWHGDHTGGNKEFGKEGTIIAHTNVRKRLAEGRPNENRPTPPAPKEALPVITFDASLSIHFNGEEIQAHHIPHGHTDGDAVITFTKSNVVHMGDLFFNGGFPFVDINSGGTIMGYLAGVEKMINQISPNAQIIPGHGNLATLDDLKKFHKTLTETIAIIHKQIDAGKSLETIQQAKPLEKWAEWGNGFISTDRWIATIFNSYKK
jgi:cyclase